jgi:hypothetical protein
MRKLSSPRKKARGAIAKRIPRRVPNVRSATTSKPRAPRRSAKEGRFTPVHFEAGYWWPSEEQQVSTEERQAEAHAREARARHLQYGHLQATVRGGVDLPIPGLKTVSEANRSGSEHWRVRHSRAKNQKETVALALGPTVARMMMVVEPLLVTMTRVAPGVGIADSDNLVSSQKYVRDTIAKVLGVDDRDPRVKWHVKQRKGPWAVEIRIEASPFTSPAPVKP